MNEFLANPEVKVNIAVDEKSAITLVVVALVIFFVFFSMQFIFKKISK